MRGAGSKDGGGEAQVKWIDEKKQDYVENLDINRINSHM